MIYKNTRIFFIIILIFGTMEYDLLELERCDTDSMKS